MTVKTGSCARGNHCLDITVKIVPVAIMTQRTVTRMQGINAAGAVPGISKGAVTARGVTAEAVGCISTHAHRMTGRRCMDLMITKVTGMTLGTFVSAIVYNGVDDCCGSTALQAAGRIMTGGAGAYAVD